LLGHALGVLGEPEGPGVPLSPLENPIGQGARLLDVQIAVNPIGLYGWRLDPADRVEYAVVFAMIGVDRDIFVEAGGLFQRGPAVPAAVFRLLAQDLDATDYPGFPVDVNSPRIGIFSDLCHLGRLLCPLRYVGGRESVNRNLPKD
jgi:hypothetical protein